jgi:hypothetical protein
VSDPLRRYPTLRLSSSVALGCAIAIAAASCDESPPPGEPAWYEGDATYWYESQVCPLNDIQGYSIRIQVVDGAVASVSD